MTQRALAPGSRARADPQLRNPQNRPLSAVSGTLAAAEMGENHPFNGQNISMRSVAHHGDGHSRAPGHPRGVPRRPRATALWEWEASETSGQQWITAIADHLDAEGCLVDMLAPARNMANHLGGDRVSLTSQPPRELRQTSGRCRRRPSRCPVSSGSRRYRVLRRLPGLAQGRVVIRRLLLVPMGRRRQCSSPVDLQGLAA
jgi:hypothetical protein